MTDRARQQRRANVARARASGTVKVWRCQDETVIIKQLIRLWASQPEPKLSGRALARKLRVWESYVRKVSRGGGSPGRPVTWDDLERARSRTVGESRFVRFPSCAAVLASRIECGKERFPKDASGVVLWHRACACVQHAEGCNCVECVIKGAGAQGLLTV
jgi:hypothetical protein